MVGSKRKGAGAGLDCLTRDYVYFWHPADVPLALTNDPLECKNGHDVGVTHFRL